MEIWQNKKLAVVNASTTFCNSSTVISNLFKHALPNLWNNHNVPSITWEPSLCGTATPSNIDKLVAEGRYDAYINAWANALKGFLKGPDGTFGTADDRRVYIRFGHEMNGTWNPWSANSSQTPLDFIAMWRHVHSIFESKGLGSSHVQWVWCVNSRDSGGYTAEEYYPGNGYVDWIGIDGYNFGNHTYGATTFTWKTPSMIFDNMIGRMKKLAAKPIGFFEVSSSAYYSGIVVSRKNLWISSLFSYVRLNGIKLLMWINDNAPLGGKSCCQLGDWAVFGGNYGDSTVSISGRTYKAYTHYKTGIGLSWLIPSNATNPRLITDSDFAGVF